MAEADENDDRNDEREVILEEPGDSLEQPPPTLVGPDATPVAGPDRVGLQATRRGLIWGVIGVLVGGGLGALVAALLTDTVAIIIGVAAGGAAWFGAMFALWGVFSRYGAGTSTAEDWREAAVEEGEAEPGPSA